MYIFQRICILAYITYPNYTTSTSGTLKSYDLAGCVFVHILTDIYFQSADCLITPQNKMVNIVQLKHFNGQGYSRGVKHKACGPNPAR